MESAKKHQAIKQATKPPKLQLEIMIEQESAKQKVTGNLSKAKQLL
jgi:hypothetical protein